MQHRKVILALLPRRAHRRVMRLRGRRHLRCCWPVAADYRAVTGVSRCHLCVRGPYHDRKGKFGSQAGVFHHLSSLRAFPAAAAACNACQTLRPAPQFPSRISCAYGGARRNVSNGSAVAKYSRPLLVSLNTHTSRGVRGPYHGRVKEGQCGRPVSRVFPHLEYLRGRSVRLCLG